MSVGGGVAAPLLVSSESEAKTAPDKQSRQTEALTSSAAFKGAVHHVTGSCVSAAQSNFINTLLQTHKDRNSHLSLHVYFILVLSFSAACHFVLTGSDATLMSSVTQQVVF